MLDNDIGKNIIWRKHETYHATYNYDKYQTNNRILIQLPDVSSESAFIPQCFVQGNKAVIVM